MPTYTYTTRRARSCYGPHDKQVLWVVLKDGVEVMTGRYKPDLERWVDWDRCGQVGLSCMHRIAA